MTPVSPVSPGRPARPTSEDWALRAEWRAAPPSMTREEAGRALDALARAAADSGGATEADEVPPIPESVRDRWAEAYGRPIGQAVGPRPVPSMVGESRERRVVKWLDSFLRHRRMAWVGGAAAAAAAVAVMLSPGGGDDAGTINVGGSNSPTRGPVGDVGAEAAPIALLVPAAAEAEKAGVLAMLDHAYPGRRVLVVTAADEAAALARSETQLVVVNLGSGLVTAWSGGQLADEVPAAAARTPASVVVQVESADDALANAVPTTP